MALMQKGRIPVALELKGREPQTLYVHILVIGVLLQIIVLQYLGHFNTCP
jgi:hypothetical protein